jgi:uncharacterized membrane protein (DUF485 family)
MQDVPWQPSRRAVLVIGGLTIWPFVYAAMFVSVFAYTWLSVPQRPGAGEPLLFKYIFPLHCLTMLLMFALTGIYVFHAYKTDRIAADKKVLWVLILFLGNLVAFPIYWYLHMWRDTATPEKPPRTANTSAG